MLHREFLNLRQSVIVTSVVFELATVGDVTSVNANGVYVTQPDEQSVAQAREYIQQVMNGEIVKVTEKSSDSDSTQNNTTSTEENTTIE